MRTSGYGNDGLLMLIPAGVLVAVGVSVGVPVGEGVLVTVGVSVGVGISVDVLVAVVNVPHPLDDRPGYFATRIRLTAWAGEPAGADDPIRLSTPERQRAYENVDEYLSGLEGAR